MDPLTLVIATIALAAVAAAFLLLGRTLGRAGIADLEPLRAAKAALEQRLAVADSAAARLAVAEAHARDAAGQAAEHSEARVRAQTELAAAQESLADLRATQAALQTDIAALRQRVEAEARARAEQERLHGQEAALVAERTRALAAAQDERKDALAQAEQHRAAAETLRAEQAALRETLDQERRQAEEKLALLRAVGEDMQARFKTIADTVIAQHGESLARKNIEQLDTTLNPLRLKLNDFQTHLQSAHAESEKERARLGEQIKALSETSARMTSETHNLTQALKGKSQTQGAWGEMILSSILEKSGLREGEEYAVQQTHSTEDGERLRPDVIVRLPGDQRIVIDAKVSLTAYEAAMSADTEEEREAQLAAHVRSVRAHIKTLGGKDYQKHTPGALDYVVMFMPIEGALAAALDSDGVLIREAIANSVFIATPTTLMIALRTAANVWTVERRNRNAEDIATQAGRIYDKMVSFTDSMDKLDKALGSARDNYDKAIGQLSRGKGNMVKQIEQLKAMGAKTTKSLPPALLDAGDAAEGEAA